MLCCSEIYKLQDISIKILSISLYHNIFTFSEWMEFSPFEIGMPKYGTFMKPELFGSKFFMGQIVKRHSEPYLHFLQGKLLSYIGTLVFLCNDALNTFLLVIILAS